MLDEELLREQSFESEAPVPSCDECVGAGFRSDVKLDPEEARLPCGQSSRFRGDAHFSQYQDLWALEESSRGGESMLDTGTGKAPFSSEGNCNDTMTVREENSGWLKAPL